MHCLNMLTNSPLLLPENFPKHTIAGTAIVIANRIAYIINALFKFPISLTLIKNKCIINLLLNFINVIYKLLQTMRKEIIYAY